MNILGIDNIVIDATDLDAARHFYGTVLGLTEKYAFPERGVVGYSIGTEAPGLVIRARADHCPVGPPGPHVWLELNDARAAVAELEGFGVSTLGPPLQVGTGWVIEVADPFGNVIGLVDYTIRPGLARATSTPTA